MIRLTDAGREGIAAWVSRHARGEQCMAAWYEQAEQDDGSETPSLEMSWTEARDGRTRTILFDDSWYERVVEEEEA